MGWESNHFHTFIRPGLADQTVVPADVSPGHTITRELIVHC